MLTSSFSPFSNGALIMSSCAFSWSKEEEGEPEEPVVEGAVKERSFCVISVSE